MTRFYDANPPYIKADDNLVLFNGTSMTGLGGRISSKNTAYLDTIQEMTEAEAQAIIDANKEPEPMTEIEEKAKAYDIIMGVTGNE